MEKYNYINSLENVLISVDEKINNKYLNTFLLHKFEAKKPKINNIYFSYMFYTKQYQIFYCEDLFPFFYVFSMYYKNIKTKSIDLFYSKEYFVIYVNQEFYYCKKNSNNSLEEILEYIQFELKISIDNSINISEKTFEHYKNTYNHKIKNKKIKYSSLFLLFIYLCFLSICLIFYNNYMNEVNIKNSKNLQNLNSSSLIQKEYSKVYFSKELIKLFELLYKYKIKVQLLEYSNESLNLKLSVKSINSFYSFLKNEKIKSSFTYEKIKKGYEINATFTFM